MPTVALALTALSVDGQNRSKWTQLDYLNFSSENPFIPEDDISGLCFVTLADSFDYYKNPIIVKDKLNSEILRIQFTDSIGILTTYKGTTHRQYDTLSTFNPWLWGDNPDYFRLAFQCTDTTGNYFKVWLNTKEFAFIDKHDRTFKKQSISDFVLNWTFGFDFDRSSNPLRRSPDASSQIIAHPDQSKYKIWKGESIEIKGDWLKVKTIKGEIGWVKWREGKKVLIRMYFAC